MTITVKPFDIPLQPLTTNVTEILETALVHLRTRGRTTARHMDSKGRVCATGALSLAEWGNPMMPISFLASVPLLTEVVEENWPDALSSVGRRVLHPVLLFNDHADTTDADVEAAFEKAIARSQG